jgi:hypothetical protein
MIEVTRLLGYLISYSCWGKETASTEVPLRWEVEMDIGMVEGHLHYGIPHTSRY